MGPGTFSWVIIKRNHWREECRIHTLVAASGFTRRTGLGQMSRGLHVSVNGYDNESIEVSIFDPHRGG